LQAVAKPEEKDKIMHHGGLKEKRRKIGDERGGLIGELLCCTTRREAPGNQYIPIEKRQIPGQPRQRNHLHITLNVLGFDLSLLGNRFVQQTLSMARDTPPAKLE
jgi:hypothetical protein